MSLSVSQRFVGALAGLFATEGRHLGTYFRALSPSHSGQVTKLRYLQDHRQPLRLMTKTETRWGAGGENAARGSGGPREHPNSLRHRFAPGGDPMTHRSATCQGTIRSARINRLSGAVMRRKSATEIANGGFATTRNGRRGKRMSAASTSTTVTLSLANICRRTAARVGCNSKAKTVAPRSTRGRVSAPVPAPTSSTRSPALMPAFSTSRSAQRLSSRCQPHRVRSPDTAHHREGCHATTLGD
jgi:hypothetical protein